MAAALKVLILGGYGTFGSRLPQLPADEHGMHYLDLADGSDFVAP